MTSIPFLSIRFFLFTAILLIAKNLSGQAEATVTLHLDTLLRVGTTYDTSFQISNSTGTWDKAIIYEGAVDLGGKVVYQTGGGLPYSSWTDIDALKASFASSYTIEMWNNTVRVGYAAFSVDLTKLIPAPVIAFNSPIVNGATISSNTTFTWSGGFATPQSGFFFLNMFESQSSWGATKLTSTSLTLTPGSTISAAIGEDQMYASFTTAGFTSNGLISIQDGGLALETNQQVFPLNVAAVPEPTTYTLLVGLSSLTFTTFYRRRKSRS